MINSRFIKLFLIHSFLFIILVFSFCLVKIWAASIEIAPAVVKLNLQGEETKSLAVEIVNHSSSALSFAIEPEYWSPDKVTFPITQWLKVTPSHLTLEPNQKSKLRMKVTLPGTIEGEVVIMVFLAPKIRAGSLAIKTRIGFPVYLKNQESIKKKAGITVFNAHQDDGNIRFNIGVLNQGNSHLVPFGALMIKQDGRIVAQQEVVFEQPIFPDKTLVQIIEMPDTEFKPGLYEAHLHLFLNDLYGQAILNEKMPMIKKKCHVRVVNL